MPGGFAYDPTNTWITTIIEISNGLVADTAVVRNSLVAWAQSESSGYLYTHCLNPLACGNFLDNSKVCVQTTDLKVPSYASIPDMAATYIAAWIHDPYVPIIKALQKGTSYYQIWLAINNSPWCGGYHTQGDSPCGDYPHVLGKLIADKPETSHHKVAAVGGGRAYTPAAPPSQATKDMRKHWAELMKQLHVVLPQQLHKGIRFRVIMRDSLKPYKTRTKVIK